MNELKIERLNWQPTWPNEIWITDKRGQEEFKITLKQGDDIEIEFEWDYGYGGRGQERMYLPVKLIKDLLDELGL
jgi:hypothetical protein